MFRYTSFLLLALLAPVSAALAQQSLTNNYCRTTTATSQGQNTAKITLHHLQPFNAVAVGEELGYASMNAQFKCFSKPNTSIKPSFVLQIKPGTTPDPNLNDPYVCRTSLSGVGVTFYNQINGVAQDRIACNHWGDGAEVKWTDITPGTLGSNHVFSASKIATFIKTRPTGALSTGLHNVSLSPESVLTSYWPGTTSSTLWGKIEFISNSPLLVSNCTVANTQQEVKFGAVPASHLEDGGGVYRNFYIDYGRCSHSDINTSTQVVSLRFSSNQMNPDGTLGNDTCPACASGIRFAVHRLGGQPINLNHLYPLNPNAGNVEIIQELELPSNKIDFTYRHIFSVKLDRASLSQPVVAGEINTVLTFIVTSM